MNKKLILTWIVVFVAWLIGNFVIHNLLLLNDIIEGPSQLFPSLILANVIMSSKLFPLLILAHVIMSFGFAMIYSEISSTKPWLQRGLRYGVAVALLTAVPSYMIYYAVQPLQGMLVVKQVVFSAILVVILGVLAAFIYRKPAPAAGA